MEGPLPKLLLSGGEKFAELEAAGDHGDTIDSGVQVEGVFLSGDGKDGGKDKLPRLSVEAWKPVKPPEPGS